MVLCKKLWHYVQIYGTMGKTMVLWKQVRPNDVWTCVACSYFIYRKLT